MSKYEKLLEFLRNVSQTQSSLTLTFSEIEEIISEPLPASAKKYRPWWANEKDGTHSQRLAWMNAGWLVDKVDLSFSRVTFKRI